MIQFFRIFLWTNIITATLYLQYCNCRQLVFLKTVSRFMQRPTRHAFLVLCVSCIGVQTYKLKLDYLLSKCAIKPFCTQKVQFQSSLLGLHSSLGLLLCSRGRLETGGQS